MIYLLLTIAAIFTINFMLLYALYLKVVRVGHEVESLAEMMEEGE